ncbi:MAG: PIN domain-containing protein [Desulfobacterales bacterium]|nr:PIN domain-containing protein [Desulfobacterales bacterium]
MIVFADTSALFALLVRDDLMHIRAKENFASLAKTGVQLLTSSYILVETLALLQRRIGLAPVHDFNAKILPLLEIVWVDAEWHGRAIQRLLTQNNRNLSLVDCLSFEIMEAREITEAFTFDRHFADNGFTIAAFHHVDNG